MVFVEMKLLMLLKLKDETKKNVSELQKREKLSLNYKKLHLSNALIFPFMIFFLHKDSK